MKKLLEALKWMLEGLAMAGMVEAGMLVPVRVERLDLRRICASNVARRVAEKRMFKHYEER